MNAFEKRMPVFLVPLVIAMLLLSAGCAGSQSQAASAADRPALSYSKRLSGHENIQEVVDKVTEALAAEGFGIISDVDVAATMKKKLGEEMAPYRILGACNAKLAFKTLSVDKDVGLLLPCNVTIYQDGDDFVVSIFNVGLDHYITDDFVIDFRAGVGLSEDSDDFFTGVGGVYRF